MCTKNLICLECTRRNQRSRESFGLSLTVVVTRAWTQTWWHVQPMEEQVEVMQGSGVTGTLVAATAPCAPVGWALGFCSACFSPFDPHGKLTKWRLLLCPFYVRKLKAGHLKALSICHPLVNGAAWTGRSADGVLAAVSFCRIWISTSHVGDTHCNGSPGGAVLKNMLVDAGDADSIPSLGRSPGEGNGNLLQYSCLEHPMGRGA